MRWQALRVTACRILRAGALTDELKTELSLAVAGVECMEHITTGMISNLVDDSHIRLMDSLVDERIAGAWRDLLK